MRTQPLPAQFQNENREPVPPPGKADPEVLEPELDSDSDTTRANKRRAELRRRLGSQAPQGQSGDDIGEGDEGKSTAKQALAPRRAIKKRKF